MNTFFSLILRTNISHAIATSIPRTLVKSSPHINVRRSSNSVLYYHNSFATMRLLLSVSKINPFRRFVKNAIKQKKQIPGYSFCYKNREKRRGGGVKMDIKDTIKYKEQQDLSKLDETIEHIWIECQGKNKNKN